MRPSPTRGYCDAVDYKGQLIIIEHNPPTHLVTTMPRRTSYTTHYGLEDVGADMLRHIIAAAGDPDGLNRSDQRSSPPTRPPVHPFPYTTRVTAGRAAAMRSGGYDTRTSGEPTTTSPRSATDSVSSHQQQC